MRKVLLLVLPLIAMGSVKAAEIRSTIVDSVQLTVDGPALQSTRIGTSYGVSGSNVSVTTLGGLTGASATAPATISAGSYDINTDGQAFNYSESITIDDTPVTLQSTLATGGTVSTPNLYGISTQNQGGTVGNLAGTLSATGVPTVTAGGAGTTAIAQRTIELSVFN